ncbi:MAG: diaminopimelate epimerase [Deltaproteobacteria bacterium]|nr:diaminopimelate epimerase [Deltaproteobacteria bacterium]
MERFEKWQALGNDFVLVDDAGAARLADPELGDDVVRRLCDRRRGVGADGLLIVQSRDRDVARMIIRNADGSRAEACGNGLRCAAAYLSGRARRRRTERTVPVQTDTGTQLCRVAPRGQGCFEVSAAMGSARVKPGVSPFPEFAGRQFTLVEVGNPHAVNFDGIESGLLDELGPVLSGFAEDGINVELCRLGAPGDPIETVVWERGVGRTPACGTGACAVAAAAVVLGHARAGVPVRVAMPGGELGVTVQPDTLELELCGPVERAFAGELGAPWLGG